MSLSNQTPFRVLDVGQCDLDHGNIRRMFEDHFQARVDRSSTRDEALRMVRESRYELVLVNRLLDSDGSEGLQVIQDIKAAPESNQTPVMLVSNFEDAQTSAVASGAVRGFGKAELESDATLATIREALQQT